MIPVSFKHCTPTYNSWLNDDKITKYLETKSSTMEQLEQYIEYKMATDDLFLAIHLKSNDNHIGNIKIEALHPIHSFAEYGILMGEEKEWGKGYAYEASMAVLDFAFQQLPLRKLNLGVVAEHENAVKLYERIGFRQEGLLKKHGLYDGEYKDCLRMAIFKDDFLMSYE
jgi:[ribosomal protein S5]-alanine N-acetyltransferase